MSTLEIILLAVVTVETLGTAAFFVEARKLIKGIKSKLYTTENQLFELQIANMSNKNESGVSDPDKAPKKKRYYNKKKQA